MKNLPIHSSQTLFIIFLIHLEVANYSVAQIYKPVSVDTVCTSAECRSAVQEILGNWNPRVSPCDNFYQFVCGVSGDILPFRKHDLAMVHDIQNTIPTTIEFFLEHNAAEERNEPYWQAFKLYELCKNEDAIMRRRIPELQEIIDNIGGWPLIEGEQWLDVSWENISGKLSQLGFDAGIFFDVEVIKVPLPMVQYAIKLKPADFYNFSSQSWDQIMNIAREFVVNSTLQRRFSRINPITLPNDFHQLGINGQTPEYLTIAQMMKRWPSIDWITYLTGVFSLSPMIVIDENQYAVVDSHFIDELVNLMNRTPKAAVMNYIVAKIIEYSSSLLSPNVAKKSTVNSHRKSEHLLSARRKFCAELVTRELPSIVEAIFVTNHDSDYLTNEIKDIGDRLKNKLGHLVKQADWLDNTTMTSLTRKLSDVQFQISYQDALENNYYVEDYVNIELDDNSFLFSMLNINRLKTNRRYSKSSRGPPNEIDEWMKKSLAGIDVQYDPYANTVDIMPGVLKNTLVNEKLPKYVTYSGLGFKLGEELMKGYDKSAKIFHRGVDTGNHLRHLAKQRFNNKVECFIEQYHEYFTGNLRLQMHGHRKAMESVADTVALRLAHLVYKDWIEINGPEPTLPNLNYTAMQTFWISFVRNKCIKHVPHKLEPLSIHDEHEFRINGPLLNHPEFSEDFGCSLGSPMNPINKCIIW